MLFWLASYPKSGNTYLRFVLASYHHGGKPIDINNPEPFDLDDMADYSLQVVSPKPTADLGPMEYMACRQAQICHLNYLSKTGRMFIKTHNWLGHFDDLPLIPQWCTEGSIYLVRDPRDVVCSYAHHGGMEIDRMIEVINDPQGVAKNGGRFHVLSSWSENVKSWTEKNDSIRFRRAVMRYEDLVERPEKFFGRVIEYLGWQLDEKRLNSALRHTEFSRLQKQEASGGFRERAKSGATFFRKGKVGAWRDELTGAQVERIEKAHHKVMKEFGYACDRYHP